jgi:hypothetical protein
MPEISSTLVPNGGPARPSGGSQPARATISNSVAVGGAKISSHEQAEPEAPSDGSAIGNEVLQGGGRRTSGLGATALALLAKLDKGEAPDKPADKPNDSPPAAAAPTPAASSPATPATPPAAAAAAPAPAEAPKPAEAPSTDHAAEIERYATRNRELLAELDKLKAGGSKREPDARSKTLDEIERMFGDNPVAAIRKLAALHHNVADPASKDIDAELSGIYQDLTERELGVSLDPATKAQRESARTRKLLEREQRERRAEQEAASKPPPDDPEAKQFAEHSALIGNHLLSKQADGKTVADAFPLTMKFAEALHGHKPAELMLKTLRAGFATGEFDPKANDDVLITQAAKKLESRYQALADAFVEARKPSTATPTPADATAPKVEAQQQASRTITNASASVAPATPPAKPETTPAATKPKFRTEADRRKAILESKFGGG